MAVITFSWSRLTWPALAQRHAAPWSRKISATSSAGRDTVGGGYAGGCSCLFLSSVFLGFLRFGRASRLDLPDIGAAIEQMGGEAVAQRMHRHVFPDPRRVGRFVE